MTMLMTAPKRTKRMRGIAPSRRRKVRRIRAAIRAGEYENALKLTIAADRLLDALCHVDATVAGSRFPAGTRSVVRHFGQRTS